MNAREIGVRRIRIVTRGLAVAGAVGSVAFAGLARAATEGQRSGTPAPTPTDHATPAPTKSGTKAKATPAPPVVTQTSDPPQVTSGGT
jgi:hypothetical protein